MSFCFISSPVSFHRHQHTLFSLTQRYNTSPRQSNHRLFHRTRGCKVPAVQTVTCTNAPNTNNTENDSNSSDIEQPKDKKQEGKGQEQEQTVSSSVPLSVLRTIVQLKRALSATNPQSEVTQSSNQQGEEGKIKNVNSKTKNDKNNYSLTELATDILSKANDTFNYTQQQMQQQAEFLSYFSSELGQLQQQNSDQQKLKQAVDKEAEEKETIEEEEDFCRVPRNPHFDPVLAFILAGYAFRAYTDPPPCTYHEVHTTVVKPIDEKEKAEEMKQNIRKVIMTNIYYPHAPMITASSTGVFLLSFSITCKVNRTLKIVTETTASTPSQDQNQMKSIVANNQVDQNKIDIPSLTVSINNAFSNLSMKTPSTKTTTTLQTINETKPITSSKFSISSTSIQSKETILKSTATASLLRLKSNQSCHLKGDKCDDILHVGLKQPASHEAKVSLSQLVEEAIESSDSKSAQFDCLDLSEIKSEIKDVDFFQTPDLNFDFNSLFSSFTGISTKSANNKQNNEKSNQKTDDNNEVSESIDISVNLEAGFLPFAPWEMRKNLKEVAGKGDGDDEDYSSDLCEVIDEEIREIAAADFRKATETLNSLTLLDEAEVEGKTPPKPNQKDVSDNGSTIDKEEEKEKTEQIESFSLPLSLSDIRLPSLDTSMLQNQFSLPIPSSLLLNMTNPSTALSSFFSPSSSSSSSDATSSNISNPGSTRLPVADEWDRLSYACHTIMKTLSSTMSLAPRTSTLRESLPSVIFLENSATDTQVSISLDEDNDSNGKESQKKNIVVSFRGTEQLKWRDLLTDAQLFLQVWKPGDENINLEISLSNTVGLRSILPNTIFSSIAKGEKIDTNEIAIHFGFLQAYMSIRDSLRHALQSILVPSIFDGSNSNYVLHFTGHSLGGALATIAAIDFKMSYNLSSENIICVTYGSPKVGNVNFARYYNTHIKNSFRIINNYDMIATLPRSVRAEERLYRYRHSGRTVMMNDIGDIWVEGINDDDDDEISGLGAEWKWRDGKQALEELLKFENSPLPNVFSGDAVKEHMEDSYFCAMRKCLEEFANKHQDKIV